MKTKTLVLIGILIIAFAAMVAPVLAAADTTALTGNPASYVTISLNEASIPLTLSPQTVATDNSLTATVSANTAFTISVSDSSGLVSEGYMSPYTKEVAGPPVVPGSYVVAGVPLTNTLQLWGDAAPGNGVTSTGSNIGPIPIAGQTLYTGANSVTSKELANHFSQEVEFADAILPSTETYRIDLTYTITAT